MSEEYEYVEEEVIVEETKPENEEEEEDEVIQLPPENEPTEKNVEAKKLVELKKVGERKQEKKHEITSQEAKAGKKVLEALQRQKQMSHKEDEMYKKIDDEEVVCLEGETLEQAKRRMVQEMIEKERRGCVFEDVDIAKDKKIITNMFDVDAAPYDEVFGIQWGMQSNTADIREPRGYYINENLPFIITEEDEEMSGEIFGVFSHHNVYIYVAPGKSAETFNIFCWYGNKASYGQRGVCAMLAAQLGVCLDNHAKYYFEEDGEESEMFKEMFIETDGIKYTDSVKNENCLKPIPKDKRKMDLYKIDEVYYKLTRVEQVEPNVASLTPYDGFVFDDGKRVYVFTTKYTPNRIKNRALQYSIHLRVQNAYQEVEIYMEPSPKMWLFYKLMKLDDKSYDEICEYIKENYKEEEEKPTFGLLMRFTHNTKTTTVVRTIKPAHVPLTLKMLKSHRCYIYDCGNEFFLWRGSKTSRFEWERMKTVATKAIFKMVERPSWVKIRDEYEGKESESFKNHVADWNYSSIMVTDDDYNRHLSLMSKRIDYNALVIKEIKETKALIEEEKKKREEKIEQRKKEIEEKRKEAAEKGEEFEEPKEDIEEFDEEVNTQRIFKEKLDSQMKELVGKKDPIIYDYRFDNEGYKLRMQTMLEKQWEPTVITKDVIDEELKYNETQLLKITDLQVYCYTSLIGPRTIGLDKEEFGTFYNENSYIISLERWDYNKDIWRRTLYFWEGKKSNPMFYSQFLKKTYPNMVDFYQKNKRRLNEEEEDVNARMMSEFRILFDEVKIIQGYETKDFANLFNDRIIVKNGNYNDFHVEPEIEYEEEQYEEEEEEYDEDDVQVIEVEEEGEWDDEDGEYEYEYEYDEVEDDEEWKRLEEEERKLKELEEEERKLREAEEEEKKLKELEEEEKRLKELEEEEKKNRILPTDEEGEEKEEEKNEYFEVIEVQKEENEEKEQVEEKKKESENHFYQMEIHDRTLCIEELDIEDVTVSRYMGSHRCYCLQTKNAVFVWLGKDTDQITRIQVYRNAIDLFEGDREFVCFEEGFHYNEFWDILHGIEKSYLSLKPRDLEIKAPIAFEVTPFSINYAGIGVQWEKLDESSCYIFDCRTRVYIWLGEESIPMQQKYAKKIGFDYTEARRRERNLNIEFMLEYGGKESDAFMRLAGGKKPYYYGTEDPRYVYYEKKRSEWAEDQQEEVKVEEKEEQDLSGLKQINWEKVNEEQFEEKMKESRVCDDKLKELREKDQIKEESNKLLREKWAKNKDLAQFLETFEDEDTDIETLPDVDETLEGKTVNQMLAEIKERENVEKMEQDMIDQMIEEELRKKYGDIEFVMEEDEEEWGDDDGEYEYEYEYDEYEGEDDGYEYEYEEVVEEEKKEDTVFTDEESESESDEQEFFSEEDEDALIEKAKQAESGEKTMEDLIKAELKEEKKLKKEMKKVDKKDAYLHERLQCDYCSTEQPRYMLRKHIEAEDMENGICWDCWKVWFSDEQWPELETRKDE